MELTYSQAGDYLLSNLTLSDSPDAPPLGKYGRMHKAFLKERTASSCCPSVYTRFAELIPKDLLFRY